MQGAVLEYFSTFQARELLCDQLKPTIENFIWIPIKWGGKFWRTNGRNKKDTIIFSVTCCRLNEVRAMRTENEEPEVISWNKIIQFDKNTSNTTIYHLIDYLHLFYDQFKTEQISQLKFCSASKFQGCKYTYK